MFGYSWLEIIVIVAVAVLIGSLIGSPGERRPPAT
jgi:hypothetical protein